LNVNIAIVALLYILLT